MEEADDPKTKKKRTKVQDVLFLYIDRADPKSFTNSRSLALQALHNKQRLKVL